MVENINKFKIIRNAMFCIAAIIIISSIRLQIIEGAKNYRLSEENRIRQRRLSAPRGKIYDRNHVEIANTRPGFYVSAIKSITDDSTLQVLKAVLNIDLKTIDERFRLEENPHMPVKIAHDISYRQLSIIEEHIDELKGINVDVEPLRNYPYGELFSHVLGYVGEITQHEMKLHQGYTINDYIGKMGVEEQYETILKGTDGVEYVEVDALGREISKITEKRPNPIEYGVDLHTTLDCALTESVAVYLESYNKAACVCLKPRTGEILVLYSKPGFDPNLFVHGLEREEWAILNTSSEAPMYNRAIMSCYPCGSTFKPFIALAALDAGMVTEHKRFNACHGYYRLGNRIFKCWKKHGSLDLTKAIIHSCDVYFYQLGSYIGIDTIISRTRPLGFGQQTGIDLPNEKSGLLPDRSWFEKKYGSNWTEGHVFNLSIGQGDLLVTPLQLACAYTIFVNDSFIPRPHLVKQDTIVYRNIDLSPSALEIVRTALHGVVTTGTGTLARSQRCEACGKTGTVQNPHGEDHAVFVGFAPYTDPEILVCLFIEHAGHGGSAAAPIAGKIITTYMNNIAYAQEN
jgi:penicillin-binding protein 2